MQFKDIDGYEGLKQHLRDMAQSGRIPHNLLLEIQDGMPGISMAIAWAQYLNCAQPHDGDSCGTCQSCRQMERLEHPDLHFIYPVINSSGEDTPSDNFAPKWREFIKKYGVYADYEEWVQILNPEKEQPTIYSNDAYALERKLQLTIGQSVYRCIIIYQPDKMSEAMSNKLLKTMEEPPERTLFISVSFRPERILETIYSRMQPIEMMPLSRQEVEAALLRYNPNLATAPQLLESILRRSQGLVGRARKLITDNNANTKRNINYLDLLTRTIISKDLIVFRTLSEQLEMDGRETAIAVLDYFEECFRFLFRQSISEELVAPLSADELFILKKLKGCVTQNNISQLYTLTEQAILHIRGAISPKIVLFDTFIRYTSAIAPELKKKKVLEQLQQAGNPSPIPRYPL